MNSTSEIRQTVEEKMKSLQSFGIFDYLIFIAMLVSCALIGVYFAVKQNVKSKMLERRRGSIELEYLVGGRAMKIFPVAMSLIASWISGVALLGISSEIYVYGAEFMLMVCAALISGLLLHFVFLPVFLDLNLTSTYEYLEARFDRKLRMFGSIIFTIATMIKMPIVIYVPALAFNQVTGINIHIITPIVCLICIFYTCVGGIKAVVWTDVVQTIIMFATMFLIIIKGTMDIGGFSVLLQRNLDGGRLELPELTMDPTVRHSVLSMLIGGGLFYTQVSSISQCMMQRYLALPHLKAARRSLWILTTGVALMLFLCCVNGLVVYATYHKCDPLTTKLAKSRDQLLPLLVMDAFKTIPGVPGVFIAGVFSATLSSLSTGLNSLAAITLEDFIKPYRKTQLSQSATNLIMKGVVVIYGAIAVALVYIVQNLGGVLHLAMSTTSVTCGPLFAVFIMGLMIPRVNAKCALVGGVSGLLIMAWVITSAHYARSSGEIVFLTKPVSVEECTYDFVHPITPAINSSLIDLNIEPAVGNGQNKSIYHMSYLYYTLFGGLCTIVIALLSSVVFGANRPGDVDPSVVAPFVRKYLPEKKPVEIVKEKDCEKECITHKFVVD